MAFKFDFKTTAGRAPAAKIDEAVKTALRALEKKLKRLRVSISLKAIVEGADD